MDVIESTVSTTPPDTDAPYDVARIKRIGRSGAVWVILTSAIAMPLTYYRNWLLGRFGSDGDVVGQFALILLFIQIVTTFVLFGGIAVTTNYLPKIRSDKDKSAFIFTYTILSVFLSLFFVALLHLFPGLMILLLKKPVNSTTLDIFSITAPMVVLAQMVTYALVGLTEFRLSSLLEQLQLVLVCCIATIAFFLFQKFFIVNALSILTSTICAASAFVILVGGYHVSKKLPRFCCQYFLPAGFWRFSSFVQLNYLLTFANVSIDQFFILSSLGVKELGAYFIFTQCSQLIGFLPGRIGQVMLSSFSQLVATDNNEALRIAYLRLCRIILILSTPLALFLILFSRSIAGIFGEWYAERHFWLLMLSAIPCIGFLGAANFMLITAKEQTGSLLLNCLFQVVLQFIVTILFIDKYGVYAVIAGKAVGQVSAQVGAFYINKRMLNGISLPIPWEFWVASSIVFCAAATDIYFGPIMLHNALMLFVILVCIFLTLIHFQRDEITSLLRHSR